MSVFLVEEERGDRAILYLGSEPMLQPSCVPRQLIRLSCFLTFLHFAVFCNKCVIEKL